MDHVGSLLVVALPLLLLYLLFTRARRQQQGQLSAQRSLQPGQRVVTTAGLYATVVAVETDVVILQTGPGQESRWARAAIGRVLSESDEPEPEPGSERLDEPGEPPAVSSDTP